MNIEKGNRVWRNPAGQRHRTDGPAIEYPNGGKEWWVNDKQTSKQNISYLSYQLQSKVLLLTRAVNPYCEINVAKYYL